LEREYERSSGFLMSDWSSSLLEDGITYGVSYGRSTMGASVDEGTHAKSWIVDSPTIYVRKEGRQLG